MENESMEQLSGSVDAAWGEEIAPEEQPTVPADQPAEQDSQSGAESVPAEQQEQADQPAQPAANQPELFTLKNRDETRQVTREEAIALAQKGWDYDHVRSERDKLRQDWQEAEPALALVRSYAQRNGMTVEAYLDYCRRQELVAGGMSEQAAAERTALDKERSELERRQAKLDERERAQDDQRRQAQEQEQARQRDIQAFYQAYPGVDPKAIPKEVWDAVRAGQSLTNAYTMHENRRLQAELAAARQNKRNSAASPGSLGGEGAESRAQIIEQWWDEAEP